MEESKKHILPEILELLKDEQTDVKLGAYESLVNLLEFFSRETRKELIIPYIKSTYRELPTEMIPLVAKHFGLVLHNIYSNAESITIFNFYR